MISLSEIKEIKENMLRKRASKINEITETRWQSINKINSDMVNEYLQSNKQLSPDTLKQYTSRT